MQIVLRIETSEATATQMLCLKFLQSSSHRISCAAAFQDGFLAQDLKPESRNWRAHFKIPAFTVHSRLLKAFKSFNTGFLLLRKGSGAQCQKCPQDSFTENYSCSECEKCPPGSKAPAGATSRSSCVCDVGVLYSSKGSWTLLYNMALSREKPFSLAIWSHAICNRPFFYFKEAFDMLLMLWSPRKCGCPEHEALLEDICVKCVERGLDCSLPGSDVLSARPLPGFTRLYKETRAFKCLAPDTRCNANSANLDAHIVLYNCIVCIVCIVVYFCSLVWKIQKTNEQPNQVTTAGSTKDVYQGYNPSCAEGYTGVMCMECAPKYFATRSRCRRCQNATAFRNGALMILGSLVLVLVAIGVGIWLWIRRMRSQKGPGPLIALREQLKVQAPILLQLSDSAT